MDNPNATSLPDNKEFSIDVKNFVFGIFFGSLILFGINVVHATPWTDLEDAVKA